MHATKLESLYKPLVFAALFAGTAANAELVSLGSLPNNTVIVGTAKNLCVIKLGTNGAEFVWLNSSLNIINSSTLKLGRESSYYLVSGHKSSLLLISHSPRKSRGYEQTYYQVSPGKTTEISMPFGCSWMRDLYSGVHCFSRLGEEQIGDTGRPLLPPATVRDLVTAEKKQQCISMSSYQIACYVADPLDTESLQIEYSIINIKTGGVTKAHLTIAKPNIEPGTKIITDQLRLKEVCHGPTEGYAVLIRNLVLKTPRARREKFASEILVTFNPVLNQFKQQIEGKSILLGCTRDFGYRFEWAETKSISEFTHKIQRNRKRIF